MKTRLFFAISWFFKKSRSSFVTVILQFFAYLTRLLVASILLKMPFLCCLDSNLPEWLQSLIMCCFEVSEFDIQSSAVGTLLDLINLTLSVNAGHAHGLKSSAPVVVVPMISQQALGVIEKSGLYEVKFFVSCDSCC